MKTNSTIKKPAFEKFRKKLSYIDKTLVEVLIFIICMAFAVVASAQNVSFNDANFKTALLANASINTVDDGEISEAEASAYTGTISIGGLSISDMTGIEAFTSATSLIANSNPFTTLDVSSNTALTVLNLDNCSSMNSLTLGTNSNLQTLVLHSCPNLSSPNLNGVTNLIIFSAAWSNFTSLDLNGLTSLEGIFMSNGELTALDLSTNTSLINLDIPGNDITALDVSSNSALTSISANNNQLESLNIANGNNASMTVSATGNGSLQCVTVDDIAYAVANYTSSLDAGIVFSRNCADPEITIPDANFKAALTNDDLIDTNFDDEIQVSEAQATTALDLSGLSISDLTGIEEFIGLVTLDCSTNSLSTLNLAVNINLEEIDCSDNNLINLNIRNSQNDELTVFNTLGNTGLTCIAASDPNLIETNFPSTINVEATVQDYCSNNDIMDFADAELKSYLLGNGSINTIDDGEITYGEALAITGTLEIGYTSQDRAITDLTGLEFFSNITGLEINRTDVTSIDLSPFPGITYFQSYENGITSLDLSDTDLITNLKLRGELVPTLDLSNLSDLEYLSINNAGPASLDLTSNTSLIESVTTYSQLTSLNLPSTSTLTYVNVESSALTSIDVSALSNLEDLSIYESSMESIDVSNNPNLTYLGIYETPITTVDLSSNLLIEELDAYGSQLSSITFGANDQLSSLELSECQLVYLDLTGLTALGDVYLEGNPFFCVTVDDVATAEADYEYDEGTPFSLDCDIVEFADENFESVVVADGSINTNGDDFIQTSEAEAYSGVLTLSGSSISDLDGVEAFTNITTLYANNNSLINVDLSSNLQLTHVRLQNNPLESVDVTQNVLIDHLETGGSNLTSLDVSSLTNLEVLKTGYCSITHLDLSNNLSLTTLDLLSTDIYQLDLSQHVDLAYLYISGDNWASLNVANGTNDQITTFDVSDTPALTCLQVDDVAYSDANWTDIDEGTSFSTDCEIFIPDANFKAALVGHDPVIDLNDDGKIQFSEAESFTGSMVAADLGINDATGVEFFKNITTLILQDNNLTSIDLTRNTSLVSLYLRDNAISEIDVSKNVALELFNIRNNGLNALDLSKNIALKRTEFEVNNLNELDVTNNPDLLELYLQSNNLEEIDLSNNPALTSLRIHHNDLTEIDLSNNPGLRTLLVSGNDIETIDLSNNPLLSSFWATNCLFESVDFSDNPGLNSVWMSNSSTLVSVDISDNPNVTFLRLDNCSELASLDVRNGNNEVLTSFDTRSTPKLTCISVDNPSISSTNWTAVDEANEFSVGCDPDEIINIPDANFKAILVANGSIDTTDDDEITIGEAVAYVGSIEATSSSLSDLTGIEYFTSLTGLNVALNDIAELDVSNNVALTSLRLGGNDLSSLDLSSNVELFQLIITDNPITSIDLSNNTKLAYFTAGNTGLTSIDLSNNTAMTNLSVYNESGLTVLDVSTMTELKVLTAFNNALTSIDLSNNPLLEQVLLENNQLSSIDLSNNPELFNLNVARNDLTALDVTINVDLTTLNFYQNDIAAIDISNNPLIQNLIIQDTDISEIDVSLLTGLRDFRASNTLITELDLSNNPDLYYFIMSGSLLETLDLRNGTNESITTIDLSPNASLTCVSVDNAAYSKNNWADVDDPEIFNLSCDPNDIVNIPDAAFKAVLLANASINTTDDGEITYAEAEAFTDDLIIGNASISDATGLEAFSNITKLWFQNTDITTIDISNNSDLVWAFLNGNEISSINIGTLTKLETLFLNQNQLTTVDVSMCPALKVFYTDYNTGIASVDITQNSMLEGLSAINCGISSIDLSGNPSLTSLNLSLNNISDLDISSNTLLEYLNVNDNSIEVLDLREHTNLIQLRAHNNSLVSLQINNGNNYAVEDERFNVTGNADLTCIAVDNPSFSTENWTDIDEGMEFKLGCDPDEIIDIPDANFKAFLIADGSIDTTDDDEITVGEAAAFTGTIDVSSQIITDLTGIKYFIQLSSLNFNDNDVSSLDLSNNTALTSVTGYNNSNLSEFVIGSAASLTTLNLTNGNLSEIDLSGLPSLNTLYMAGNSLTELDLSINTGLAVLGIQNNQLTALDLSNNTNLQWLYAQNNSISTIDLSNNSMLSILYMEGNGLTALDISSLTLLEDLYAGANEISSIDLSSNTALVNIDIYGNNLTSIDFTNNTALEFMNLNSNDLTALDVSTLVNLDDLTACCMDISSIDLSNNPALTEVWLQNNNLTEIDLSTCPLLNKVVIYSNDLTSVNLANGANENISDLRVQFNSTLGCISVDDPAYSEAQSTWQKDASTGYSLDCSNVETDIISFSLEEQSSAAVIDVNDHTVDIEVDLGTDLTNLEPTISISDGATINPVNESAQDFSTDVVYTVTSENPSVLQDWTITVVEENATPSELALSNYSIDENNEVGAVVGTLSTIDPNVADVHTYSLVAGGGDADNASFTISGNELLAAETFDFETKTSYAIRMQTDDGRGGVYDNDYVITVNDLDESTPSIVSLTPSDDDLAADLTADLVVTFDEDIAMAVSGTTPYFFIKTPGNQIFEIVTVTTDHISGNQLIIPHMAFAENQEYYVYMAEGVISDLSNNWQGLEIANDEEEWNFITEDVTDPEIVSLSPAAGSEGVSVGADLVIEFSEEIIIGTGDFQLQVYNSQSLITSFEITSEHVSIAGATLTIDLPEDMPFATHMYANIFTGGVTDLSGNDFVRGEEIANKAWDWTTEKEDQSITFTAISDMTFGDADFTLEAIASSSLDVSFSIVSGPISLDGNLVTITGAGEAVIAADQIGDESFNAATQETQSFTIAKADQTITITAIEDKLTTDPAFIVEASTSSELELTYEVDGPATIDGQNITLDGTAGTVTVTVSQSGTANYNGAETTASFEVIEPVIELQDQTITFDAISDKVYGDVAFEISAISSSSLDVSFSIVSGPISLDGNLVAITGAGEAVIAADQIGDESFNAATQETQSFTIAKADQTITIVSIADKVTTDTPFDIEASTTSDLILTYAISGPATIAGKTVTLDGTEGTVTVTVGQDGNDNYNAAEAFVSFEVTNDDITSAEDGLTQIKFFPNPATDWLTIHGNISNELEIQIFDLRGNRVLSKTMTNEERISIESLNVGMYFMKIKDDQRTTTTKLLIRR
ncbi:MAG: Ig-like domain-containing protein [Reichenbachiella sp.]